MPHLASFLRAAACASLAFGSLLPTAAAQPQKDPPARPTVRVKFDRVKTSKETKLAVQWLEAHQGKDGSWSSDKFLADCPDGDECWGPGEPQHQVGVSGLAAYAILRATPGNQRVPVPESIHRWIKWTLKRQKETSGLIGSPIGQAYHYDHAAATLALCAALKRLQTEELREAVQASVDYITRARKAGSGWRYDSPPSGRSDSCVTVWMLRALLAAESAGIDVDEENFSDGAAFLKSMMDEETARVGYTEPGSPSARVPGLNLEDFPTDTTETLTSGTLVAIQELIEAGHKTVDFGDLPDRMILLLDERPPEFRSNGKSNDALYWYYSTTALCRTGRSHRGRRRAWKIGMKKILTSHQRRKGHSTGSWEPLGPWGWSGGRVFTTSLGLLTLLETIQ